MNRPNRRLDLDTLNAVWADLQARADMLLRSAASGKHKVPERNAIMVAERVLRVAIEQQKAWL